MVMDADGEPTRVGYRRDDESGRNVRVSRKGKGKDIDS
jgi:large subunit ribosomal protein L24